MKIYSKKLSVALSSLILTSFPLVSFADTTPSEAPKVVTTKTPKAIDPSKSAYKSAIAEYKTKLAAYKSAIAANKEAKKSANAALASALAVAKTPAERKSAKAAHAAALSAIPSLPPKPVKPTKPVGNTTAAQ